MDSIFEEDAGEVGGEIEANCPSPRCKADTTHTIVSMYEDEIRRVQCVVCGDVHAYRKPRGDGAEDADLVPKKRAYTKPTWNDALTKCAENDLGGCRAYSIRDAYEEGDFVLHPVFEVGVVTESLPDNKVEVVFRDGARVLVHNRGDLASRMPGLSDLPTPREGKKRRAAGKEELSDSPLRTVQQAIELAKAATVRRAEGGKAPRGGKGTVPPPAAVGKGKTPDAKAVPVAGKAAGKVAPAPGKAPAKAASKRGRQRAKPPPRSPPKLQPRRAKLPRSLRPPKKASPSPKKRRPSLPRRRRSKRPHLLRNRPAKSPP
ncbi:MAG: hypothetical protein IPL79_00215 [Myxococcales bacterium]|nr:hypothetical protein [Myxococcales bacterium]